MSTEQVQLKKPLLQDSDYPTSQRTPSRVLSSESFPKLVENGTENLDKASEYDYCMVFQVDPNTGGMSRFTYRMLRKMRQHGLDLFLFYSLRKSHIFVMIRLSLERLRALADRLEFKMLLDEQNLENAAKAGNPEKNIAPIDINHDPEETMLRPYEMIYAKYRDELPENLYWRPDPSPHPFRESVRLKLTQILIESKPDADTQPIKLRQSILKGKIASFFPLHSMSRLSEIKEKWLSPSVYPWTQPFFLIKEYFGEKIGLYFKFMGHYNLWLTGPAIIGIPLQIYIVAINNFSSPAQIAFAIFIVIWAVIMLEFWKRKEKMTAIEWGMIGFEDEEVNRPEFRGVTQKSLINGREVMYFPPKKRVVLIIQSSGVIAALIAVVIGAVTSIYLIKRALAEPLGSNAQTLASILNSIQISIFNLIYSWVADALTHRENHRTDTEYEDSMISKLFLFQFVNSYASFFYIAFIAPYTPASTDDGSDDWEGDCGAPNCMVPLAINLAIIFGTRLTVGNITELLLPYLLFLRKYTQETAFAQGELLRPEREFMLTNYNIMKSSLNDYAEIAINFGFIALFVTALPIAAFAGFVSSFLEIKADAWKLMLIYQRPIPRGAEDIGMWQQIFTIIASIACITNAALSVFTMNVLDDYSPWFRMWFFILFQWVCFAIQTAAMAIVPDEPQESIIQRARRDFLTEKIIMQIPDEALGGDIDLDDDEEGAADDNESEADNGEGKSSPKAPAENIVFPIHEYTNSTFVRTPDIAVPEFEEKKKRFFKRDKKKK